MDDGGQAGSSCQRDEKRILKRRRLLNGEMVEGGLAARYGG